MPCSVAVASMYMSQAERLITSLKRKFELSTVAISRETARALRSVAVGLRKFGTSRRGSSSQITVARMEQRPCGSSAMSKSAR